ncbi:MAG TPA: Rpp14/Pop5 family protein [archaeon]|nr:Rpp14/Pop5 family protein [archaeon]
MKLTKKPSNRDKKRYVYFKVHCPAPLKYQEIRDSVMNSLLNIVGELGMAHARFYLVKNLWNQKDQNGVIKCSHKAVDEVKLSLAVIHHIGDNQVIFYTTKVSGTIKGLGK